MRVVAYLHNYPPGRLLGGELMTSLLLEEMARAGHQVQAIVHEVHEPREHNGVQVVPRRKAFLADDLEGCEVLVSHPEIVSFARNRVGDAPFVAIVHNLNPATIEGLKLGRASLIVANAQATLDRVHRHAPASMVIHPPTPAGRHPEPAGVPRRFVTAVNLSAMKGGRLFYELAERNPHREFLGVLGGHGEQIVPDRVPANVFIVGQSPSMGLVYALTRVLLFGSGQETYGMVAAEACLSGIPVIAHPLPGVREALDDAALWRDRDDIDAWQAALDELDDEDRYREHAARALGRGLLLAQRSADDLRRFRETVEDLVRTRRGAT